LRRLINGGLMLRGRGKFKRRSGGRSIKWRILSSLGGRSLRRNFGSRKKRIKPIINGN